VVSLFLHAIDIRIPAMVSRLAMYQERQNPMRIDRPKSRPAMWQWPGLLQCDDLTHVIGGCMQESSLDVLQFQAPNFQGTYFCARLAAAYHAIHDQMLLAFLRDLFRSLSYVNPNVELRGCALLRSPA